MQKIYCYVDETGQDTKGKLFLVSVVITEKEREELRNFLNEAEKESGKNLTKWRKTGFEIRQDYLSKIFLNNLFKNKIFFSVYGGQEYVDLTILTTAKAILNRAEEKYKASIFVDGLKKSEIIRFAGGLRRLKIKIKKVRGLRDESDSLIRLADAIAGFLRDHVEGQGYTDKIYKQAEKSKIINKI